MAKKIITGITLDPNVVTYLDGLAGHFQRSRSFIINAIVQEHAEQRRKDAKSPQVGQGAAIIRT